MLNLSLKEFNLSLKELKAIADIRGIRGYESMSEDRLLSDLKASKSVKKSKKNLDDTKPKLNFSKTRIEKIRKKFNQGINFLNQK